MSDFTPKTRLEKILCGVVTTAKTRLEKAVKYAVDHAGSGYTSPLEVNCTISVDPQTSKQIITTDLTAAELFAAVNAGRFVRAIVGVSVDGENVSFPKICLVDGQAFRDDEETVYEFSFSTTDNGDGFISFIAADLSANDTVVFRQV